MNSAGRRKRGPRARRRLCGVAWPSELRLLADADDFGDTWPMVTICLDEAFRVPAVVHEVDGEPVEQLGVGWVFALCAEVGGRSHEAGAEEHLPDAIHGDAGGERVLAHGDPVGEAEAVGRRAVRAAAGQDGGRGGGDFFGRLRVVAAVEDERFARLVGDVHHHRGEFLRDDCEALFEIGECDAERVWWSSAWAEK